MLTISGPTIENSADDLEQAVIIPIVQGFCEPIITHCLTFLRERSIRAWLVGDRQDVVRGQFGISILVDHSWVSLPPLAAGSIILLTGGISNIRTLVHSTDFHLLAKNIMDNQGGIGVTSAEHQFVTQYEACRYLPVRTAACPDKLLDQLTESFEIE